MNFTIQETDEENFTKSFTCENCDDTTFNSLRDLSLHQKKMHKSYRHNCEICQYKTSKLINLKRYIESIHSWCSCDSCDFKATQLRSLKRHQKSIHDGVQYSCDCCHYKATQHNWVVSKGTKNPFMTVSDILVIVVNIRPQHWVISKPTKKRFMMVSDILVIVVTIRLLNWLISKPTRNQFFMVSDIFVIVVNIRPQHWII